MAGLGSVLAGGEQRPPARPKEMTGSALAGEKGLSGFLKKPEVMAFLLQVAASGLGNRGIAASLGDGAAAVGRYGANKAEADAKAAEEARRQWEWQQEFDLRSGKLGGGGGGGRRGGGSGGGSGGSSGTSPPSFGDKDTKALAKMLYDSDLKTWKEKNDAYQSGMGEDPGPMPDILDYNLKAQKITQAQNNGMPIQLYNDLRVAGRNDQAEYIAQMYATDPAGAKKMMDEFQNPQVAPPPMDTPKLAPSNVNTVQPLAMPGWTGAGGAAIPSMLPQSPPTQFRDPATSIIDGTIPSLDPLVAGPLGADPWGMPERQKKFPWGK